MSVHFPRQKPRSWLLTALYQLAKLPLSTKTKLGLALDLEWAAHRIAHDLSFKYFPPTKHPARTTAASFLLSMIKLHHKVLDIGSNLGDISAMIAERAAIVVGVDHNPRAIEAAQARHHRHNLQFIHASAGGYLQAAGSFDVIVLSHVLEHLDDPQTILSECRERCRLLYIEVPDFDADLLNHHRLKLQRSFIYSDADHIHEFDRTEMLALIESCGLRVLQSQYIYGLQKYWCEPIES